MYGVLNESMVYAVEEFQWIDDMQGKCVGVVTEGVCWYGVYFYLIHLNWSLGPNCYSASTASAV